MSGKIFHVIRNIEIDNSNHSIESKQNKGCLPWPMSSRSQCCVASESRGTKYVLWSFWAVLLELIVSFSCQEMTWQTQVVKFQFRKRHIIVLFKKNSNIFAKQRQNLMCRSSTFNYKSIAVNAKNWWENFVRKRLPLWLNVKHINWWKIILLRNVPWFSRIFVTESLLPFMLKLFCSPSLICIVALNCYFILNICKNALED